MASQFYSARQIALHWIVAVLIALQFLAHDGIGDAFRSMVREGAGLSWGGGVLLHLGVGIAVLALVAWRLALRLSRGAPPAPAGESALQKLVAAAVHLGLYLLMVAIPVSGLVAWFGAAREPAEVHEILTNVLLAVVAVHVLGALVGQFVQRTGVLMRMLRPGSPE